MRATMTKRSYGDGGIEQRGENSFRLRYRIKQNLFSVTFHGTLKEAKTELRRLIRSVDTGEHVAPDKGTLGEWARRWIEAGAPGQKKRAVGDRAVERYDQLMRTHVLPALGNKKLQEIDAPDIDALYLGLEGKVAPRTARHVHSVLNACLGAAVRTKKIVVSPMQSVTKIPPDTEGDHGIALEEEQLHRLVRGFKGS